MGGQGTESVIPQDETTEKLTREQIRKDIEETINNAVAQGIQHSFGIAAMGYMEDKSIGFNAIKTITVTLSYKEDSDNTDLSLHVEFLDENEEKSIIALVEESLKKEETNVVAE